MKSDFINNSIFLTLNSIMRIISISFLFWVIARISDVDSFGSFSSSFQIVLLLLVICDFGFELLVVKEISLLPQNIDAILNKYIPIKIILVFFTFIIVNIYTYLISSSELTKSYLYILNVYLVFTSISNGLTAIFRGLNKYKYESICNISINILIIFLSISFLLEKYSVLLLLFLLVFIRLLNVIILLLNFKYTAFSLSQIKIGTIISSFKDMMPFGFHMIFGHMFFLIDTIILLQLGGEKSVAIYQAAFKLMTIFLIIPEVFNMVFIGNVSRLVTPNKNEGKNLVIALTKIIYIISLVVLTVLWLSSSFIIDVVYNNPSYSASVYIFQLLLFVMVIRFYTEPQLTFMTVSGFQSQRTFISFILSLFSIFGNIYFVPIYGYKGTVYVSLLTHMLLLLLVIYFSRIDNRDIFDKNIIYFSVSVLCTLILYEYHNNISYLLILLASATLLRVDVILKRNLDYLK